MEMSPSAHVDTFCRDRLPPVDQWPELRFDLAELAYPDKLNCAVALLDDVIERHGPDRRCLVTPTGQWTYGDLLRRANQVARVLTEDLGLRPGNRVLLRGPNNPWLVACWFGALRAGAVVVTTMPLLRAHELSELCEISQPVIALCDHRFTVELAEAEVPGLAAVSYGSAEPDDLTARCAAKGETFEAVATAADDVALIAFTSGTTGRPKATMHFHRDLPAICDTFSQHILKPVPDDLFIGSPPLGFTFGLGGLLAFPLRAGAATLLIEQATAEQLADMVATYGATVLFTAPTAYRAILDAGLAGRLSQVRRCVSAGEHLPVSVWERFREATGLRIIDGIGATELLHVFISAADDEIRPGATGKPVPGYQAAILTAQGEPVPDGTAGLLAVKGPTGCRYLSDERQATYVLDGWNLTGDTYIRDADGYFWYQARSDDMIVSSGYNIAGPEVEQALILHPDVADCAVIGVPDDRRGMLVKACVVLRSDAVGDPAKAAELQTFVKQAIAPYKYPRQVEFVESLPRTSTGKLRRDVLRRQARVAAAEAQASQAQAPASVEVERRVEWPDTDAAGHYHFGSVQRWVEAAEAVLLRRLGLGHLYGSIPRVHFDADYLAKLWFGDSVRTRLRIADVGRSSLSYAFEVHGQGGLAATGRMTVVHCAADAEDSSPWPDEVRELLLHGGPQDPEFLGRPAAAQV
jgi:2-aminobenzoate-CoA ligase